LYVLERSGAGYFVAFGLTRNGLSRIDGDPGTRDVSHRDLRVGNDECGVSGRIDQQVKVRGFRIELERQSGCTAGGFSQAMVMLRKCG